MPLVYRLALMGLPPVDSTLIESLLHQGFAGAAAYERVHALDPADLIIANADDANTVRALHARKLPVPVLLIGDGDAGTGWPVVSRPIQLQAVMRAVRQLMPQLGEGAARSTLSAADGDPPETPKLSDRPLSTHFEATVPFEATAPFAPLETPGASDPDDDNGFADTRPFGLSASGALTPAPSPARPAAQYDPIDVRSVLLWREAQVGAPANASDDESVTEAAELVVETTRSEAPESRAEAPDGMDDFRDAEQPEPGAGDWRERLQQQALVRRPPVQLGGPAEGPLSSSFADRSQLLTVPPPVSMTDPVLAILLVGEERLAESSLIRVLRGFGHRVDYVSDCEEALANMAAQEYGFAFLDSFSLGPRTVPVCRALRKFALASGQNPLKIVVLGAKGDMLRRLFARMAGCDAWFTVPLDRKRLRRYLRGKA